MEDIKKKIEKIEGRMAVKELNDAEGSFIAVATAEVLDRDNEIVKIDGLDYSAYLKNPVVTWMHNWDEIPVGRVLWIRKVTEDVPKLLVKIQLHRKTELSQTLWELIKEGYIKAVSITFKVYDFEDSRDGVRIYTKTELMEIAIVSIPANPQALILEMAKKNLDLAERTYRLIYNTKGAVAPHEVEFLPDDTPWDGAKSRDQLRKWASSDGSGDPDKIDWSKYRQGFAWYDDENKELLSSYKLPHHYVKDGKLVTCWRGVVAAMASLFGARGGVDIPDEDWDGVYRHLAKHYRDHGNEPPNPEDAWTPEEIRFYLEEILNHNEAVQKNISQAVEQVERLKNLILDVVPTLKAEPSEAATLRDGSQDNKGDVKGTRVRIKIKK
jgi:HK97 family phage prohead protease